jgi:hypothetical protein
LLDRLRYAPHAAVPAARPAGLQARLRAAQALRAMRALRATGMASNGPEVPVR